MWKIKLNLCNLCDEFSMQDMERLLSYAAGIEELSMCTLCGGANSKLTIHMSLPLPS